MVIMIKEIILTCIVQKERRGGYSALCPELDVASRGDSIEEARKNLEEAVTGHLQTAKQEGLFNEILERLGLGEEDITKEHPHISFSSSMTVPLPA